LLAIFLFSFRRLPVFKCFVILPAFLLLGAASPVQESATPAVPFQVPANLVGKSNPVKPTPEGLAKVRKMWGYDCAICHGASGDGKGDIAAEMKPPLKDYRDPDALKAISDGELFYIIQKGKGQMPSEGDRAKDEDIWNMVSLVKSFAKK
jgi:mono/diheme cytochrome c family protein